MNLSDLYSKSNRLQRSGTKYLLDKYYELIKWSECGNVLDIGCGVGDVTKHTLLPLLTNVNGLIGCDISESMVEFAKMQNSHSKINYTKLDIGKEIPVCFEGYFDQIFSFFCLHWIKCYRTVFGNIKKLLRPGGRFYVHYITHYNIFDTYKHLADMPKWKEYMTDLDLFLPPTLNRKDVEETTRTQLNKLGFEIKKCEVHERIFTFNSGEEYKDFIKTINPFINRIPINLHEEYLTDLINDSIKHINDVQVGANGKVHVVYKVLAILGEKNV